MTDWPTPLEVSMTDWFIAVMIGARLMFGGPMSEEECQHVKQTVFPDKAAICIDKRLINAKQRPA